MLLSTVGMLEDLGYTALSAASAFEALDLIRTGQRIDLLITDQAMPKMTGAELAAIIRSELPTLPVIIASGFAEFPSQLVEWPRLAKPFPQAELARAIADELAKRSQ